MAVLALTYVVDVFLPWVPRRVETISLSSLSGVETSTEAWLSFFAAFGLLLSELGIALFRTARGWRDGLAGFLAISTAGLGLAGVLEARSTWFLHQDHSLASGAWIAIPLSAALLVGGAAHLERVRRLLLAEPAE